MNKALNDYSKEADRTIYGYSGRLKKIWDEHHPEHTNLTANHLATQAKRIEEKGLLMETRLKKTKAANTQNVNTQEQSEIPADINEEQQENITEELTTEDKEQNERFDDETVAEIILSMKPDWINNFEQYFKVNVHERKYLTRKDRKIEDRD